MVPGDGMCSPGCQLPVCAGARPRVVACGELQPREVWALRGCPGSASDRRSVAKSRCFGVSKAQNFLGSARACRRSRGSLYRRGAREKIGHFFTAFGCLWGRRRREKKSGRAEIHLGVLTFTAQPAKH